MFLICARRQCQFEGVADTQPATTYKHAQHTKISRIRGVWKGLSWVICCMQAGRAEAHSHWLAAAAVAGPTTKHSICILMHRGRMIQVLYCMQADQAHSHWLAAAAVPGPHQSAAFAKLGLWYASVKTDLPRARKCFQRGLGLNPVLAEAGIATSNLFPLTA